MIYTDEKFDDELITNTLLWAKARVGEADAEDLSQQILCEAIASFRSRLSRGQSITSFYAWYWRVAENQLKIFLRLKYNRAVSLNGLEDFIASEDTIDSELLSAEERGRLNFAVSRLSALHRQIIIDFYLREKPAATIAAELNIPLGTVKRRLFDAREQVKRSMEMENTGRSAYAPAELNYIGTLGAPNYWSSLQSLIVKQIFVACRSSARTAREIADEIAVAPVYFEENLEYLLANRFIKETSKGKYLTDIVILPAQTRFDFDDACYPIWVEIAPKLRDAILAIEDKLRAFDFYGNDFSRGRLMWLWYAWAVTRLSNEMVIRYRKGKTLPSGEPLPKNNGKDYRYTGFLLMPDERIISREHAPSFVSNMHWHFRTSDYRQITYANLYENDPFGYHRDKLINDQNIALYMKLAKAHESELTEIEQSMAAELVAHGYLEKRGGGLYPTVPIMSSKAFGDIEELLRAAVEPIAEEYYAKIAAIGDKIFLPHIRTDLYEEYVNWVMSDAFFGLAQVLELEMKSPVTLELPADFGRSSYCTAIYYR